MQTKSKRHRPNKEINLSNNSQKRKPTNPQTKNKTQYTHKKPHHTPKPQNKRQTIQRRRKKLRKNIQTIQKNTSKKPEKTRPKHSKTLRLQTLLRNQTIRKNKRYSICQTATRTQETRYHPDICPTSNFR